MLGFSPLASAPLSDDGIVVVSSSISLSGVASQVIHNDVVGINSSTKSITTVSSVTDVNDVVGVNSSNKSISNVSSQVTQGSLSTAVDITLSSTSTTGQLGTINRVVGVSTTLDSVSTTSQAGTTEGSTSSNKAVTSVSSTGSVNDSSVSTSSNKVVTSVSATGQVRTPQIGPSENLVAVSVTGNVTSPSLVVSSSVQINQVTSTSQVGSLVGTTDEIVSLTSISSTVSVSSVQTTAVSTETLSSLSSSLSASDLSLVASSNKSLVNVSSSSTVNSLVVVISDETSLSGVSSSVDVNDLPFVGIPVNATVNLDDSVKPNLYYSGIASAGVTYTSSTQYQSSGVGAEFYFKVASNYTGGTQYFFQADGNKTGWSYQRAYGILQSTDGIGGYVRLGNQLGRNAAASVSVYLPNSGTFSPNSWYKGRIYSAGQRVYAQIFDGSGSLLASNSQLMTISYGSYTTSSYQFFLDEFVVASSGSSNAFTGQITDFSITGASLNPVRSRVLYQRTTPTWAATNSFTNNATAADTLVFDSPFNSSHLVTTSGSANAVATLVTSNVTTFPTGVSSSAQVQDLEETLVSSSKTLDSTSSLAVLRTVTQTHSSNKTLPSADFTALVNDVDKIASSSVLLDSTASQTSQTNVDVTIVVSLNGVTSSKQVNDLSVNLSTSLTTVSSAAQVSDLVVDIDEIIPPSLSVSSQVSVGQLNAGGGTTLSNISSSSEINPVVLGVLLEKVEAEVTLTPISFGVSITGVSSSSQVNALEAVVSTLINGVSSSASVNSVALVSNGLVTVDSVLSLTDVNDVEVFNNSTVVITKVSSELSDLRDVVGVSSSNKPITSVSSLTDVNDVSLVIINNGLVTVDSVSSTTSTPNQLTVSTDEVANLTGVEAGTAVSFGGVESQEAILRKVTTPCQVGTLTINVGVTLPSASSTFNASDQVKGVINVSVQLSTLPLVNVSRGSITLSTDGFNFEEFKNAFERARTVYVSRAA